MRLAQQIITRKYSQRYLDILNDYKQSKDPVVNLNVLTIIDTVVQKRKNVQIIIKHKLIGLLTSQQGKQVIQKLQELYQAIREERNTK